METKDTTGQMVMAYSGAYMSEIIIAIDNGHYEGTRAEYNVRRLNVLHTYQAKHAGPVVKQITAREGYGMGWGETSKLYPITDTEAAQIAAELTPSSVESLIRRDVKHGAGYCHNCESYCFGDCGNYKPER